MTALLLIAAATTIPVFVTQSFQPTTMRILPVNTRRCRRTATTATTTTLNGPGLTDNKRGSKRRRNHHDANGLNVVVAAAATNRCARGTSLRRRPTAKRCESQVFVRSRRYVSKWSGFQTGVQSGTSTR